MESPLSMSARDICSTAGLVKFFCVVNLMIPNGNNVQGRLRMTSFSTADIPHIPFYGRLPLHRRPRCPCHLDVGRRSDATLSPERPLIIIPDILKSALANGPGANRLDDGAILWT